jgi:RHS repeat-associated protein
VNVGGVVVGPISASYSSSSSTSTLAQTLATNLPANAVVNISYGGGASFTLTTKATGAATNSSTISTSEATGCVSSFTDDGTGGSSSVNCAGPGWTITPSQNFAGGTDNGFTTFNDTGNVTVSFVVPGITPSPSILVSETVPYGQNDSSSTLAQALATKFSADSTAVQFVTASASAGQLNLVTTATGSGTNYSLALSSVTNSSNFPAGSTSFQASGPAAFVTGQSGTLFDAGTITATLNGFGTATAPTETVNYSQGSTTAALAASLAAKINSDSKWSAAVTASVASGSSTIVLTSVVPGITSNQYSVGVSGQSNFPSFFPTPSFASPVDTAQLSGGSNGAPSFDPSVVLTTTYKYDPLGHLLQIIQGQQTQTFVFDGLGRMTSSATPETVGQPNTYTYTDFGAIAQKTDPRLVPGTSNHITTTYGYDPLNRVKTIAYNDNVTPNVTYTYNPPNAANNTGGQLASVTNGVESKAYQYDLMGRITQCLETIGANQYTVTYAYAANGQITSITYPSQLKANYGYDPIGRLQTLGTATQTIFSINPSDYNAAGTPVKVSYGNNITGMFGFNSQLQTSSILFSAAAPATPLFSLSYNYGDGTDNGQIRGITDNVVSARSTSYQYDQLGRLQTGQTVDLQSANTWKLNYAYDRYGNLLDQTAVGGTAAMPTGATPVDPATNHIQGLGAIYDAAGNMVSDGLNNYMFDANNKLTSSSAIPGLGGSPVTFAYDSAGKLINKNGTYYIYADGRLIAEYALGAAANAPSAEYINLGHRQVATIVSGVTTFNFADHLSTRVTADSSGNPVNTYGHFPYGQTIYQTGPTRDFLFTSYRRDANTGLDNADARFYSSRLGRFVSRDPLLGDNGYDYADDDPINEVDPTGKAGECTTNPFDSRPLPLCGPDQLGGGSGTSASCGISFDDGGFSLTFTSNCNSFTVNFQGPSNPFGDIQGTLTDLLRIVFNPDTCPGGTFECPDNGSPIFGQPTCDSQWCALDNGFTSKYDACIDAAKAAKKKKWDVFFGPGGAGKSRVQETEVICGIGLGATGVKALKKLDPWTKLACLTRVATDAVFFDNITKKIEKDYGADVAACGKKP